MRAALPAESDREKSSTDQNETGANGSQQIHSHCTVLSAGGVVVKTEQQNLVDWRADLVGRSLHQTQTDVARRIFHAVEVFRKTALGGEDHDCAGVRKLVGGRVVLVVETDSIGERFDIGLVTGEEVPA